MEKVFPLQSEIQHLYPRPSYSWKVKVSQAVPTLKFCWPTELFWFPWNAPPREQKITRQFHRNSDSASSLAHLPPYAWPRPSPVTHIHKYHTPSFPHLRALTHTFPSAGLHLYSGSPIHAQEMLAAAAVISRCIWTWTQYHYTFCPFLHFSRG